MKKAISILLAFLMVIVSVPIAITATASGAPTITFENAQGAPGKEFSIDLILSNNPGFVTAAINVAFDDGLVLIGATGGDAFPSYMSVTMPSQLLEGKEMTGNCNFGWMSSSGSILDSDIKDGTILTLTFRASDSAEIGDVYSITISSKSGQFRDKNLNPISIETITGQVEIIKDAGVLPNVLSDFTYELTTDGIVITGYVGTKEDVIIADSYEIYGVTYDVIRIDQDSFYEKEITSVVIPETVQAIGDGAFFECRSLMSITVLGKNTEIGEEALGYYQYSRRETRVVEGVTIYGYTGSTAEVYAGENEIAFVALSEEHIHNYEASVTKEPTCTEKGIKTFTCTACGDIYTEEIALNPDNHADYGTKVINAKKAACTETGYTGDTVCLGCEAVLEAGTVIDKLGHDFGAWTDNGENHTRTCQREGCDKTETADHIWNDGEETKDATCKEQGEKTYTCTVCGTTKTEPIEIDPTNHVGYETETKGYVAATCEVDGYTGDVYCLGCGNKVGNGAVINKLDHNWGAWFDNGENHIRTCQREGCDATETADHVWNNGEVTKAATCKEEGVKTFTCTVCGATKTEPIAINPDNHADYGTKVVNAKEATCTEDGYTGDTVCLGCEAVLEAGTVIDKLGHDFGAWTDNGENHIRTCQREGCDATETADHIWNDGEETKAATCKEEGVKNFTCTVCGATKTEPIAINPDNHADYGTKVVNAKEATCEEAGYTGDTVCLGCEAVLEAGTVIDPLDHDWSAWSDNGENHIRTCQRDDATETADHVWNDGEETKVATCKEEGVKTFTCTVCGAEKTEPIAINSDNHADYGTEIKNAKAATCKEDGYTGDTVCKGCGAVITAGEVISKETVEHTWDNGEITTAATCKEEGVKTFACTVCGTTKTEAAEIDPSNHADYGTEIKNAKDATCKEDGYTGDAVCKGCGAVITEGEVISKETVAHTWDNGEITTAATCKEEGVKTFTCTVCGATKTETVEIDPTNHADYGTETKDYIAATCETNGYTGDVYCIGCSNKIGNGAVINKLGHDWGDWTDNGENHIRTCQREGCGATETADHVWNDGEVTKAATCKEEGVKAFTCTVCGATKTVPITINPDNHADYGTEINNAKDATCKEDGYTGDTVCKGCGATLSTGEVISKETVEHTWDNGEITTTATCKEEGVKTFTCTVCGTTKTEAVEIDPTNHADYGTEIKNAKEATCKEDGYTGDTICKGCGAVITTGDVISKETVEHTWDNGEITTAATCKEEGVKTFTCTVCGITKTEVVEIDPTNHADYGTEIKNAKAATCKEDGYTGDTVCKGCGSTLGNGELISKETADHTWNDGEIKKAANCKEEGTMLYICTVCGTTKEAPIPVDANNHADYGTTLTGAKEATCTAKGYSGDKVCNGCAAVVEKGADIDMIPHDFKDAGIKQDENGKSYRSYICTVCGAEKKESYEDKLEDAVTAIQEAKKLLDSNELDDAAKAEVKEKLDALEAFLADYVTFDENGNVVSGNLPYDDESAMDAYRTLLEDLSTTAAKYAKAGSFFEALANFIIEAKEKNSRESFFSALVELIKQAIILIVKIIAFAKGL